MNEKDLVQTDLLSFITVTSKSTRKRRKKKSVTTPDPAEIIQPESLQQIPFHPQTPVNAHESLEQDKRSTTYSKKGTPPSIETAQSSKKQLLDKTIEPPKLAERIARDNNMSTPEQGTNPHPAGPRSTEETEMETRLLNAMVNLISPLQSKMDLMQTSIDSITKVDWDVQQELISKLANENNALNNKIEQLEHTTMNLHARLIQLEERIGGCNIIITGLAEDKWEKEAITLDRTYDVLSELIQAHHYNDRLATAKLMEITCVKRLGN